MSRTFIKLLPALALAGLLAGCGGKGSNAANNAGGTSNIAAPTAGTVIVTVNGKPITTSDVNAYVMMRTNGTKIHLNDEQRYQIAHQLVQLNLAYQAAQKQNLAQDPDVRAGLALQEKFYLAHQLVETYMNTAKVPDSKLKSEYAKMAASQSGEEYEARHILVKDKSTADSIIKQLDHGADFAKLAKKYSTDKGSAKQGGELGWFKPNQMVAPFSAAVEKLKPGQYTKQPVQTKFGWHVILLEKERTAAPPSYTASKPTLEKQARSTMLRDYFNKLQAQASVDWKIPNPASVAAAKAAAAAKSKAKPSASTAAPAKPPAAKTH